MASFSDGAVLPSGKATLKEGTTWGSPPHTSFMLQARFPGRPSTLLCVLHMHRFPWETSLLQCTTKMLRARAVDRVLSYTKDFPDMQNKSRRFMKSRTSWLSDKSTAHTPSCWRLKGWFDFTAYLQCPWPWPMPVRHTGILGIETATEL